ncbi:MAG: hypothetical protein IAI50_16185 [Candidatus Eremiobacteraeota bacterium]|nr:hypothetical protein [Candidatus Eremiobacteraeota bacterium]
MKALRLARQVRYILATMTSVALCSVTLSRNGVLEARSRAAPQATPWPPAVIPLTIASARHTEMFLRHLYPKVVIRVDELTNSIVVVASPDDLSGIRTIITGLDVRNLGAPQVDVVPLHNANPRDVAKRMKAVFPHAHFSVAPNRTIVVTANAQDMAQTHTVIAALDAPPSTPMPAPALVGTAFHINQAHADSVARAVAKALPRSRVSVSGSSIVVTGSSDDIAQVKPLLEQLDRPPANIAYTAVYRLSSVDATSVASLLSRSFASLTFVVDKDLNAISTSANFRDQARIASAITQLDAPPGGLGASVAGPASGVDFEVISLQAAVPPAAVGGSSSATDIAQTTLAALSTSAPDLKITVQPNSTRLVLSGSSRSRELAKNLINQLDVSDPLVELDTRVLEVDEGSQSQLGLKFPTPVLGSTYSEVPPSTNATGMSPPLLRLQGLTRTPLTLSAELDFLISTNRAKILEDPRITTFSGRTATLRAGETVNILTTTGGGTGTVATTQIQSFQTGVTLDITPVVNKNDYVTVTLHPSVNSIAAIGSSGVPNIQTRDTTTTIGLHDGETLVIGGLIEDTDTRSVQKIPILGDLPLLGRLFQDVGVQHTRNELVVTVTPRILKSGVRSLSTVLPALTTAMLPLIAAEATLPPNDSPPRATTTTMPTQPPAPPSPAFTPSLSPKISPTNVPGAFAQTNAFVFGAAPQNNFADANQAPQIFYLKAQPTVVEDGTPVTISVLTTTNVTSLTLGPTASLQQVMFSQIGPGKWQSTFNFDSSQLPNISGNTSELVTASAGSGTSISLRVPFSLVRQ